jgi:integrase
MKKSEVATGKNGKAPAEIEFPYTYTKPGCSISVKIYHTPTRGYDAFTVVYYQDSVRKKPTFPTIEKALAKAGEVCDLLGTQNLNLLKLSGVDAEIYKRARSITDPLGVTIDFVASQYAYYRSLLGDVPPAVAVEDFARRHRVKIVVKTVAQAVTDLLEAKEADGCSDRYQECLKYCLKKFQDRFQTNIAEVTGPEIDVWLRGSGLGPRTRNNIRTSIHTLFEFAKGKNYLYKDHDALTAVAVANDRDGDIEVFTPAEMIEILRFASERMHPFLVLGAFAGIRHAEIQRLDWRDIHFDENIIEIRASKAKTASRRLVPIVDNLREWLLGHRETSGEVAWHRNVAFEMHMIAKRANKARRGAWACKHGVNAEQLKQNEERAAKLAEKKGKKGKRPNKGEVPPGAETAEIEGWAPFAWKHNALRHSFISYRVADIQNIPQAAMEAGNSPQMILKHYRELVRPKAAKEWFAITPKVLADCHHEEAKGVAEERKGDREGKIVPIPKTAAA